MKKKDNPNEIIDFIISTNNFLIIQDLDGVCIPLVKDPLNRTLDPDYIKSVSKFDNKFLVLTCGEHEGVRGVNRIIENSLESKFRAKEEGLYLPGLAACGVEFQDRFGNIVHPGLTNREIDFLSSIPKKMAIILDKELDKILPKLDKKQKDKFIKVAVCDTRFTPTMNLNQLISYAKNDICLINNLQLMMERIMNRLLIDAQNNGLGDSFYLHLMPNLGTNKGKEIMKYAKEDDIGTTDIQFIINGAIKQAGLLVLLNKYIAVKTGIEPFGPNFNVRNAPKTIQGLIDLCKNKIPNELMPLLIGVGDTVTSDKKEISINRQRGGSDRQFLTLIQELGKAYNKKNQVFFVNSGNTEVYRPSIKGDNMLGISDPDDNLKFNLVFEHGPKEYITWVKLLSSRYQREKSIENVKY